jgi:hypothetical protein
MAAQKKQLSLDANVIFDLAAGQDFAHDFREIFQGKGYSLVLPPTAAFELHIIFTHGDGETERELARIGLTCLKQWDIRPFDLDSAAEVISGQFARTLLRQRLIPEDEFNDGLILAETSLAEIPLLVTSDQHLLNIDEDALQLAFNDADLSPTRPVHPRRLLRIVR